MMRVRALALATWCVPVLAIGALGALASAQEPEPQPLPLEPPPAQPEPPRLPAVPAPPSAAPPAAQPPGAPGEPAPSAPPGAAPAPGDEPPTVGETSETQAAESAASAQSGPIIELPPEAANATTPAATQPTASQSAPPAPPPAPSTLIGGYGQFNLTSLKIGPDADFDTRANLRRLVLFVSHEFTPEIDVYAELEWENAVACPSCQGAVEVEQAFVDWKLFGDALALRAGLVLVPMGIINLWHEPPVFHGVERPATDTWIIPTTWRELGAGIHGQLAEIAHYELYLTTTLVPTQLGPGGLASARTLGSLAPAKAFAVTGRFEVEPLLGLEAGVSAFASDLGPNSDFFTASGRPNELALPLVGYAIDARLHRWGMEARVLWTQFFLPNSDDLMSAYNANGVLLFPNVDSTGPVPTRIEGGYIELAYDVLRFFETDHQLLPFARFETYDTQADVPDGTDADPARDIDELTMGLSYRPIPQLVFKSDVQLRDRRLGLDELQINFGVGYMY